MVAGGRGADPQTRETYGEHLSNFGQGFGDTFGSTVDLGRASGRALVGQGGR